MNDADTVREALHALYAYTSDDANPPGEGRSWTHQQGRDALSRLSQAIYDRDEYSRKTGCDCHGRGTGDPDYTPAFQDEYQRLWHEAAAERDELRAQLRSCHDGYEWDALVERIDWLEAERDRLREALREIADEYAPSSLAAEKASAALDGKP